MQLITIVFCGSFIIVIKDGHLSKEVNEYEVEEILAKKYSYQAVNKLVNLLLQIFYFITRFDFCSCSCLQCRGRY